MEFGKVEVTENISEIDFSLPPDTALTKQVLKAAKNRKPATIYMGCAKWGRPDWVGKIYPPKTKAADFLEQYAKHFNSIELNATFYRIPDRRTVSVWKSKVGADFRFVPKFSQIITHIKRLKDTQAYVDEFLNGIDAFGENLGPVFLMLHPQMGLKHLETIRNFIGSLPKELKIFVEVRHPEWFSEQGKVFFEMLHDMQAGSIITDAAGRRDCVHMNLSTPDCFIRFVGNSLHETDYVRVDEWVQRMKSWMKQGIENIYFFMHQHEELYSPELIRYTIEKMNKECKLEIPVPHFYSEIVPA
jgi:uncharacterized protein YecE (DUF72 family)